MDYREFVDQAAKEISRRLPEELQGAVITTREISKLQGESYYGLTVHPEHSNVGVSINPTGVYERMQFGMPYEDAMTELARVVENGLSERPTIRAGQLTDYDFMKDKMMVQVVPTAGNEEMLSGIPHVEREDMSLVYRMVVDSNEQGMASALVTNTMLSSYGITAEQLHADVMASAPEKFPASVRSMNEVLSEIMGIEPEMMPDEPAGMYVATCNHGINGAGCMFYPGFMDQAAEKLGGDFFVLPSSVHEVILLPDKGEMTVRELETMVQEINQAEVQPADRLSDSVYHYDAKERLFEKGDRFEERQKEKKAEKSRPKEKESLMQKLDAKKKEAQVLDGGKKIPHKAKGQEL